MVDAVDRMGALIVYPVRSYRLVLVDAGTTSISTTSVYGDYSIRNMDEGAPLASIADPTVEDPTGPNYGPLKVLCEQAVHAAMPGQTLVVRPGLIVGPHDQTNRFAYWPRRVAQGGDVLAPDGPEYPARFVDVRDLAVWTIRMIESGATGTYNARGPNATRAARTRR